MIAGPAAGVFARLGWLAKACALRLPWLRTRSVAACSLALGLYSPSVVLIPWPG